MSQHRLVLLFIVSVGGVGLDFDGAESQLVEGVFNQMPVDDLMVSLVVVAEEIVIGSRRFVVGIVEAADLLCSFDNPQEYISTLNELRKDAQASLGGFIDQDVWGIRRRRE